MNNANRPDMQRSDIEHAMTLLARLDGGDRLRAQGAQAELSDWRQRSSRHEQAYQEALQRWQALDAVRGDLRRLLPEPPQRTAWLTRLLAGWQPRLSAAALVLACCGFGWYYFVPLERYVFSTEVAQVARFDLPDRSLIELNGGTQLQVRYYRNRREVSVQHGEARFHVQRDAGRPFRVRTGDVTATVVGTVFSVARRDVGARVQVEEGAVDVAVQDGWWRWGDDPHTLLRAGQQIRVAGQALEAVTDLPQPSAAAWTRGLFVFDDTPLSEVAAQLQGWLDQPLRLADDAAAAQRITGTFHLREPRSLLELLPRIASVQVGQEAGGLVIRSVPAASARISPAR